MHKRIISTAAVIALTLATFIANGATDEDGFLIVKKGQKVIVKNLAMLFGQKSDLKKYQDFYSGSFTPEEADGYNATLLASSKAVQLHRAVVAKVVGQERDTHEVQVQIEDTEPVWVDGAKLDAYSLQNLKDDRVE